MKGKKILKKIAVSILTLAVMCSNIPVTAGSLPDDGLMIVTGTEQTSEGSDAASVSDPAEDQTDSVTPDSTEETEETKEVEETENPSPADPEDDEEEEEDPSDSAADPADDSSNEDDSDDEDQGQSPADETPDADAPIEQPDASGEPQKPETPEDSEEKKPEYQESEPLDFENQIPIADMNHIPDQEGTASSIWFARAARTQLFALYNMEGDETDEKKAWTFDTYYVNQQDPYNVTKTSNFDLKYQMEFHASQDLAKGAVLIKIDASLYTDRNGNVVLPTEIAVPEGTMEAPVSSRTTPFNYYTIDENEDGKIDYLVFFNYKKIPSGTNAAWQVLYKNQKLMNIVDETSWTLTPQISVDAEAVVPNEENPDPAPARDYDEAEFESRTALTGRINSSVTLTSVSKTAYNEPGRNYGPGLYTKTQVERYINGSVPSEYLKDGRLDTENWRFVVWDVKLQGSATQPWSLVVQDHPSLRDGTEGMRVVGYKDNSSSSTSYRLAVGAPDASQGGDSGFGEVTLLNNRTNDSWGNRFYVVTAYPAKRVSSGTEVQNEILVRLIPLDGQDEDVEKVSTPATWIYADYDWDYTGEKIGIDKKNGTGSTEDNTRYTGWLDVYRRHSEKGEDYGEIPYSTTSVMHGYSDTHWTKNEGDHTTGDYIPGTYYTFTTADDFLYLYTDEGNKVSPMTGEDYYFSDITITQTDYGYDVWEDERQGSELGKIAPEDLPKNIFNGTYGQIQSEVRIYAMLANSDGYFMDAQGWALIYTGHMDATGRYSVNLREALEDDTWFSTYQPYRIKVEHDSIDFESICQINVNVCLKAVSKDPDTAAQQPMNAVLEARGNTDRTQEKSPVIQLENLSSAMCQAYRTNENGVVEEAAFYSFGPEDVGENSKNYQEPGLKEATKELYPEILEGNLPIRDSAVRELTWLNEIAEANKRSQTTNDVNNNRVLVDYYLTAYDGYEIYDRSCLDELKEEDQTLISPARTHVVFYDLLPYGMQYDASTAPTAGRITELDKNGYYRTRPGNWSKTQVQVVVDPSTDIIPDYRGTGRTMVAFHVIYTGADAASYTDQKWIEGWGVSFRAYYDWKDISQINDVDINSNLCAFMPDFSELAGGSNNDHPSLCGLNSEIYFDNGEIEDPAYADMVRAGNGEAAGNIDGISEITGADGNPINIDEAYRTVLYAKNTLSDNVAIASSSRIETLVHADADTLGAFGPIATVPVTENPPDGSLLNLYTYDNTVTVDADATDIVIFNRLEMAAVDRNNPQSKDPFYPFVEEDTWSGTFRGIDTSGLDKQGISGYVIYYSAKSDARITEGDENPEEILNLGDEWYTEAEFIEKFGPDWQSEVRAVAVDLKENIIEANSSVSFRIKMTAPMPDEDHSIYTYNNASFSSVSANGTRSTVTGNSVRVTISQPETLEVIKKTSGAVPSALEKEAFEFRIYEEYLYDGETEEKNLAYTQYRLYKQNQDGTWEEQRTQAYATDGNGYFYLHADEKAVFELADTANLKVKETENVFWETQISTKRTKVVDGRRIGSGDGDILTMNVTNVYRPVLYAQKSLSSVPEGAELTEEDQNFTFQIRTRGSDGNYHPLSRAEYWIVDSVRLDGGIPAKLSSGTTDVDGRFTIRAGEIIALFPGVAGTQYELSEIVPEDTAETVWNWYCANDTLTGKLPSGGDSRTITNYYRWKDLLLKKEITHQTKEDYDALGQVFTFRLMEAELDADGEPLTDADGNPVAKTKEDGETYTTAGLEWVLLDENGEEPSGEPTENPGEEEPGVPEEADEIQTSGTIDADGTFACKAGYRTVKVKGLEAGKLYVLEELTDGISLDSESNKPLYVPNNGTAEVTMPIYSTKKDVTITNDYQMRPLSVTKTVVKGTSSEETDEDTVEQYRFTVEITRTLADGTTKVVQPEAGTTYLVTKQGAEDETRTFGEERTFVLSDGETAVFKDIGMLGDQFTVKELDNKLQIYPADKAPFEGILSGDGGEASFVNGESGSLLISKIYTGLDEIGKELVECWKWEVAGEYEKNDLPNGDVGFILNVTVDGEPYTELIENAVRVNQLTGAEELDCRIMPGVPMAGLMAGYTIVIPVGEEGGLPEGAVYTLEEVEESRHSIKGWDRTEYSGDDFGGRPITKKYWMQIDESADSESLLLAKSVTERPAATIYNEVRTLPDFAGSKLGKWMTPASNEVPAGAKLMWRVEKYDAASGTWSPAEGISYAVFTRKDDPDEPYAPVSTQIETTKSDGYIPLVKAEVGYPFVWFQEDQVYVNLYKEDEIAKLLPVNGTALLRLVEVPEASDSEWGLLAGYATGIRDTDMADEIMSFSMSDESSFPGAAARAGQTDSDPVINVKNPNWSLNASPESALGFVNSNLSDTLEIEKTMSEASETAFTMILKQVLSTDVTRDGDVSVTASAPAAGIPYTVIKTDGSRESGTTGPNGEIELYAGERAVLSVPEGTMWTVSEQTFSTPNYHLVNMTGEQHSQLTKLNENLMLINLPASKRYELIFDDNGGSGGPGVLAQVYKQTPENDKVTFTIPDMVPERKGYVFEGWTESKEIADSTAPNGSGSHELSVKLLQPGESYSCGSESTTLYAKWATGISLTYIDSNFSTEIEYYSEGQETVIRGALGDRPGYTFEGWTLSPGGKVDYKCGASITLNANTTLYAVWVPKAPTRGDLYDLLGEFVEVRCVDTHDAHKHGTKSYSTGSNSKDAVVGEVYKSNESYCCDVTLDGDAYLSYYVSEAPTGVGNTPSHKLIYSEDSSKTITLRWDETVSEWKPASDADSKVTFQVGGVYTVAYRDGVDGDVFGGESQGGLALGAPTPQFINGTPSRLGYEFMGWSPTMNPTVCEDNADENFRITYTATWKKK